MKDRILGITSAPDKSIPPYAWGVLDNKIVIEFGGDQEEMDCRQLIGPQNVWGTLKRLAPIFPNFSEKEALQVCKNLTKQARYVYLENLEKTVREGVIPHVSHRVWITSPETPSEPPISRLECFVQSCRVLNATHGDWQHVFWCLNPDQLPQAIAYLTNANVGIKIASVSDLYPNMKTRHIVDGLIRKQHYTIASDVVRQEIIAQRGGLYCDMGIIIQPQLARKIDAYEYIWWLTSGRIEFCIMGAAAQDPFFNAHCNFLGTLSQKSSEPTYTKLFTSEWYMHWTGSGCSGAHFVRRCRSKPPRALFVPNSSLGVNYNLRSWGDCNKPTLFGNSPINKCVFPFFSTYPKGEEEKYEAWKAIGESYLNIWRPEIGEVLFGISKGEAIEGRKNSFAQSREIYFAQLRPKLNVIPHIHHRIWLTRDDQPAEMPEAQLHRYLASCEMLTQHAQDWSHIFWCLDPAKIPFTIEALASKNIQVRQLGEILPCMKGKHVFDALLHKGLLTKAGNIARLAVINQMGGVYCDVGVLLKHSIAPLVDCYEAMWWLWPSNKDNGLDLCIVGAPPQSASIKGFFDVIDRFSDYPLSDPRLAEVTTPLRSTDWVSSPLVHACIARYGHDVKTLFVGDGSFAESMRLNSWGQWEGKKPTKFGVKPISQLKTNIFAISPEDNTPENMQLNMWLLESAGL